MIDIDDVVKLLEPISLNVAKTGLNLVKPGEGQADVEIMAVLTKALPISEDKFDECCSNGNDYISMQFTVLDVGQPGFSSVPYSKKKQEKGDKKVKMPLYTRQNDKTIFHTFKKAEINMERGERVDSYIVDEEKKDLTFTLEPGLSFSTFMNKDKIKGNTFINKRNEGSDRKNPNELSYFKIDDGSRFWNVDMLPVNTLVWLQIGVGNDEQAMKGKMIRVKKIMPVEEMSHAPHIFKNMPQNVEMYDNINEEKKLNSESLCSNLYLGNSKIFSAIPNKNAFSNYNKECDEFILCNFSDFVAEVAVQGAIVRKITNCTDNEVACDLLDMCIFTGSLSILMNTSINKDNVDLGTSQNSYNCISMYFDSNQLMSLEKMKLCLLGNPEQIKSNPDFPDTLAWLHDNHLLFSKNDNLILWSDQSYNDSDMNYKIVFVMDAKEKLEENAVDINTTKEYFSWSVDGYCRKVRICLLHKDVKLKDYMKNAVEMIEGDGKSCEMKNILDMQMRVDMASAKKSISTRKRRRLFIEN